MIRLAGDGNHLELIDDMAECGVDPLASPPISLDFIYLYYKNVQLEHSPEKVDALYANLLAACQRVMSGLQVHYRNAGNTKTPTWERQDKQIVVLYVGGVLVEAGGKATTFPSVDAARSYAPPGASPVAVAPQRQATKRNPRNFPVLFNNVNAPEGFQASVSRGVYGRRYESSCEGMASFRLRTLPQYYSPVGVVCGTLKSGGIGHCVAVFVGPGGFYLSSNGKEPMLVKNRLDIQGAVVGEFVAIYSHGKPSSTLGAKDFDFGFGVGPKPAGETPAQREPIVDQIMIDGKVDEALRIHARTKRGRSRASLDWNNLLPAWSSRAVAARPARTPRSPSGDRGALRVRVRSPAPGVRRAEHGRRPARPRAAGASCHERAEPVCGTERVDTNRCYVTSRGDAAPRALLRRHGGAVLGVRRAWSPRFHQAARPARRGGARGRAEAGGQRADGRR